MSHKERSIEAVIFDLDDTLLDWSAQSESLGTISRPYVDGLYDYLATADHDLPDKETFFQRYRETIIDSWREAKKTWAGVNFAQSLRQLFASLELELDRIDMDEALAAYDWQPVPSVVLYEDVLSVLETLRQQEYKIGLITNSMLPMWMRDVELQAYDIIDYFDARITSGDTGYMKPHPAIYRRALDLLHAAPEQAVFVGDRPANDIAGANEAGLVSVLMDPPHLERDLDGVEPDYTISRLRELLPILEALESKEGLAMKE